MISLIDDWFVEPFRHQFMRRALFAVLLAGLSCASIGVYVVLRRMAFIGDALAHTMLPGIVIAYLNKANLFLGGLGAGIVAAIGIGWLSRRREIREDTAIGIVFTGMFAVGVLLMSHARSYRDFHHMLFGNPLGVSPQDLWIMTGVAIIVLTVLILLHKELELTSFDPRYASVIGLRPHRLRYLLLIVLALAVVAGIQAVGVILTGALLITPAATAALATRRLVPMIFLSLGCALVAGFSGLYISFHRGVSAGAAIVLSATLLFAVVWGWRQILEKWRGRHQGDAAVDSA